MADPVVTTNAAPPGSTPVAPVDNSKTGAAPVEAKAAEQVVEPAKAAEPAKATEPAKAADDKSPLGAKKEGEADPAAATPIKYEFKLPEGVKLDEKQLASFSDLGNKLKLAPEAAQELFDFHYNALKSAQTGATAAAEKAYNDLIGGWKGKLASDPELSGSNEGPARELLGKFMDEYGSPEAREAFDLTGAGWNPAIAKMMLKAAKALSEGGPTPSGNPKQGREPKTPGTVLYGPTKTN